MATPVDTITRILTGSLPLILIGAALLAFPLSFLLLRLYRRAVLRSMARQSGAAPRAGIAPGPARTKPPAPLKTLSLPEADTPPRPLGEQELYRRARQAPWRAAAVYGLGGAGFAGIMVVAVLISSREPVLLMRFLMLFWVFAWPLLLTLVLVAGATPRSKLWLFLGYFGCYVGVGAIAVALYSKLSILDLVKLLGIYNLIPTALLLGYLSRRVRAVGPLVLTFLVLSLTGSVALLEILLWSEPLLRRLIDQVFSLGLGFLGGGGILAVLVLLGFGALGVLGGLVVQRIRAGYEAKKISDQSLTLASLWLLFGLVYSIFLSFQGVVWIITGLVGFGVYKALTAIGFAMVGSPAAGPGIRLLLLRVFALGKRSERLFDELGSSWRYLGPIQLIAGPDLATTTVAPHQFLEFLTGKLSRSFIDSPEALNRRLAVLDLKPDRDWRYRINDFFCFSDTWQLVLTRLVAASDAVLMDLRSFSPERAGCIFEINEIINTVSLDRAVFIVDSTTDEPFLRQTIERAWDSLYPGSPNYDSPSPQLNLFHYDSSGSHHNLLRAVCAAASPSPT